MLKTMLISITNKCAYTCPFCPFKSTGEAKISQEHIRNLLEKIGTIEDMILICSEWYSKGYIESLLSVCYDKARKISLFLPISETKNLLKQRKILQSGFVSNIVFIMHHETTVPENDIYTLLSSMDIDIGIWFISELNNSSYRTFQKVFPVAKRLGLKIWIGETPYSYSNSMDPVVFALRVGGENIGLPYSSRYGYRISRAYIDGYPASLMIRPPVLSNILYLSPVGELAKHPKSQFKVKIEEADIEILRKIIFMPENLPLNEFIFIPKVDVILREELKGVEIDQTTIQLLEAIQTFNSLKVACKSTGIPYSSCVQKIALLEKKLGKKLVTTIRGGKMRGRSYLSELGLQILETYKKIIFKIYGDLAK